MTLPAERTSSVIRTQDFLLRLAQEEREAIQSGIEALCTLNEDDAAMPLRALLKRLG